MKRREFIAGALTASATLAVGTLMGCGLTHESGSANLESADDRAERGSVTIYDCYAMAMYYDGTMGPKTGTILAQTILAGKEVTMEFWHGHGGKNHKFTVTADHFAQLRLGKKVFVETSSVDSHTHKLFIDPVDARYRVPGATPVIVP